MVVFVTNHILPDPAATDPLFRRWTFRFLLAWRLIERFLGTAHRNTLDAMESRASSVYSPVGSGAYSITRCVASQKIERLLLPVEWRVLLIQLPIESNTY